MKNIFKITVLIICVAGFFTSCDKNLKSEGLSQTTTYPEITLTGGNFYLMEVDTVPFVDPGVTAILHGKPVPVVTTGYADAMNTGLYFLKYTTLDETGQFKWSVDRKVLVVNQLPLTEDYSGTYTNAAGTLNRLVTKPADELGWYLFSDSWAQDYPIPVEFVDLGTSLQVIPGSSPYGPFDGTVTYDPATNRLVFRITFTSGPNKGYTYSSTWTKKL